MIRYLYVPLTIALILVSLAAHRYSARADARAAVCRTDIDRANSKVRVTYERFDVELLNWEWGPEIPTIGTGACEDVEETRSQSDCMHDFLLLDNRCGFSLSDVDFYLREWDDDPRFEPTIDALQSIWDSCAEQCNRSPDHTVQLRAKRDAYRAALPLWARLWRARPQPSLPYSDHVVRVKVIPAGRQVAVQIATRAYLRLNSVGERSAKEHYGYVGGYCRVLRIAFTDMLGKRIEMQVPGYSGDAHDHMSE